ncbi:MAG: hypothetical protein DRO88_06600 [Promethearchaeia archaeon]|nr:MAG: hypothetical protein DRO88_06600 [Candidatus Lokiarchaeia archaeon]
MSKTISSNKSPLPDSLGVRAVIISNKAGIPFVTLKIDFNINENTMIPFLSAVHTFCENYMGETEEFYFSTGSSDIYTLVKTYEGMPLMIFALLDSKVKKLNIRNEAENALDAFVANYPIHQLKNWDGNLDLFAPFEAKLQTQVDQYLSKIKSGNFKERLREIWNKIFT